MTPSQLPFDAHVGRLVCWSGYEGVDFLNTDGSLITRTVKDFSGSGIYSPTYTVADGEVYLWHEDSRSVCVVRQGLAQALFRASLSPDWRVDKLVGGTGYVAVYFTRRDGSDQHNCVQSYSLTGQLWGEWYVWPAILRSDGRSVEELRSDTPVAQLFHHKDRHQSRRNLFAFDYCEHNGAIIAAIGNSVRLRNLPERGDKTWRFGFPWCLSKPQSVLSVSFALECKNIFVSTEMFSKHFHVYLIDDVERWPRLIYRKRRPMRGPFYQGRDLDVVSKALAVKLDDRG